QAEDGIRVFHVTGVQTCALPISSATFFTQNGSASSGRAMETMSALPADRISSAVSGMLMRLEATTGTLTAALTLAVTSAKAAREIGRASWRGRVWGRALEVSLTR